MTAPVLTCWKHLPRLSPAVASMRDVAARMIHAAPDRWHERHGLTFELELAKPLARYSVCVVVDGCMGAIELWLECGSVLPEVSFDVLDAVMPAAGRIGVLEWLLMPWLEDLESTIGCEVRMQSVALQKPPPADLLAVSARLEDGRRANLAVSGPGLAAIARACPPSAPSLPAWCRVEVSWLLSISALSILEMRMLTRGALLRTRPNTLQAQIESGGIRMAAHWTDNGSVEIDGRVDPSAPGSGGCARTQPLVTLDELSFDIDIVLSTQRLTVEQLGGMCKGAVVPLAAPFDGQRVVLVHRGVTFARGELAHVEDEMVVMITECSESPQP